MGQYVYDYQSSRVQLNNYILKNDNYILQGSLTYDNVSQFIS